jgi:hypothetical protein
VHKILLSQFGRNQELVNLTEHSDSLNSISSDLNPLSTEDNDNAQIQANKEKEEDNKKYQDELNFIICKLLLERLPFVQFEDDLKKNLQERFNQYFQNDLFDAEHEILENYNTHFKDVIENLTETFVLKSLIELVGAEILNVPDFLKFYYLKINF